MLLQFDLISSILFYYSESNIEGPAGIALDLVAERIYWVDRKLHVIESANYYGADRHLILRESTDLTQPSSIAVFEVSSNETLMMCPVEP